MKRPSIFKKFFKINLNKLANYKSFTKGWTFLRQIGKVNEEIKEFNVELGEYKKGITQRARIKLISEGLDIVTAMLNLLFMIGMTNKDFQHHIDKLNKYKMEGKYGN